MGRTSMTTTTLAALAVFSLGAGCSEELDPLKRRQRDDPSITPLCDRKSALTATPIKRLAKAHLESSVKEFLSPLSEAARTTVLAAIQARLDLVPADNIASHHFSANDSDVAQDHVDAVVGLALAVASQASDGAHVTEMLKVCGPEKNETALDDDGCLTSFVRYFGRKAFRRPLTVAEGDDFKAFYRETKQAGQNGMKAVLARLLAHPSFYYRFDHEGAIVEGKEGEDALYRLSRWELLSKLTFLFWHAPPTDALYDRVEGSDITKEENLRPLVDEVLADSKSESGVLRFFREWLTLDKTQRPGTEGNVLASQALILAATGEDALPPSHREDMIAEVLDLARHYALTTEGSFDDILTSPYSFARTPALAKIYGVAPWDGAPERLVRLPDGQRSGLLTRAALVAANGEYTRPILKGERILSHILCRTVPPPPPTLEIKPLIQTSTKTTREVTDEATNPAGCASCHQMLNPLGFASESYDAIGRFRMKELRFEPGGANVAAELALDTKALVRMPSGKVKEVKDAVELSAFVAESGEAHGCLVQNYFEFATGRPNEQLDACEVESLGKKLTTGTRSLKGMLRESVLLQSFRQRKVK